jgi:tripartite-type tricarboxylate transporter receptor subunit TctC
MNYLASPLVLLKNIILGLCLVAGLSTISSAQPYPAKPVKIIVQTAAGSSIDVAARLLAEHLTRRWGQQAFVVNQPGAGGAIATRALTTSPNDGYTLFLAASSVFLVLPELQKNLAPDINAIVPIAFVGETPMAIAVSAKSPAKSLAELFVLSKTTAGGLNCAVSTRGGLSHLSAEALREASQADLTLVNYPGTAQALTDVIADRVPVIVDSISALIGPASDGQIRIIAIASSSRLNMFANIPIAAETLPGFEATAWFALTGPAGTDTNIIRKATADVNAVLRDPDFAERLQAIGTFVRSMNSSELEEFIGNQKRQWAPVVQKFVR